MKKIFLILSIIVIFSVLPAGNAILIDESEVLKRGHFLIDQEKIFISNFEAREFEFNPIIRISGITASGMPFYIIENSQTGMTRGFVVTPDEITSFQFKNSDIMDDADKDVVQETKTNVNYLVSYYDRIHNMEIFSFSVKTFDESLYSGTVFDTNFGKLDGVNIQATITDKDNNILEEFYGITQNGIFVESIIIKDNLWSRGTYVLDLELEYDGKSYHTAKEFFVLGDLPDHD